MAQYELVRFLSGVRLVCYAAVEDERQRERGRGGGDQNVFLLLASYVSCESSCYCQTIMTVFVQQLIEPVSMTLER